MSVFGTRPEMIKMAPVVQELKKRADCCLSRTCVTGQHRQMIDPLLRLFEIEPDYDLDIMRQNQSLEHITTTVLSKMGDILHQEKPDCVLVQGDTTTSMAASLAAFYQKLSIGHVEAGLRTGNKLHPYPEEVNRRIIDSMSDLYFAPTEQAKQNLLREGVADGNVAVTGNTVIDALLQTAARTFDPKGTVLESLPSDGRKLILLTAHRRENFGQPLLNICQAIRDIARRHSDEVCIVYPVHLNPNVQAPVHSLLTDVPNVFLTEPLDYLPFVQLIKRAYLILTDSGGLQEEGPSLGKPVLVLRRTTERPEGVAAGTVQLVGTETADIIAAVIQLLEDSEKYRRMSMAVNPYGDGTAARRIVDRLLTGKEKTNGREFA
ncbi:MAG: UDP-N-acetylglucosamine 2-epimerase [Planctomycetes bacterium RBG_13_60_9]|nr:MAG: UDP-N-acetylglucosamine 2-epimerase [Planctomycetes bacterium RBG_13_60_9]